MIIPTPAHGSTSYRLVRGTKLADIPPQPPLPPVPPLSDLDGPFQLAEYLSLKVRHDPHDVKGLVEVPGGDESVGGKGPDRNVWIYEHLRRIPIDLTPLITALLPVCNRDTCGPEMRGQDFTYFCVAHGNGTRECSSLDYILHTLDWTVALLNNPTHFPSRMQIPSASLSHFPSMFRRLSRIFSHAYFYHREAFELAESENSLYARFAGLCEAYELVGKDLLQIPNPNEHIGKPSADEEKEEEEEKDMRGDGKKERKLFEFGSEPEKEKAEEIEESEDFRHPSPFTPSSSPLPPKKKLTTRGTLSRGKAPRTSMLWAHDAPEAEASSTSIPDTPIPEPTDGQEASRKRSDSLGSTTSVVTAVQDTESEHPSEEIVEAAETPADTPIETPAAAVDPSGPSEPVSLPDPADLNVNETTPPALTEQEDPIDEEAPKDEIDLLEETGELPRAESSVAPLPPPTKSEEEERAPTPVKQGHMEASDESGQLVDEESGEKVEDDEGMEDVVLDDEKKELEDDVKAKVEGEEKSEEAEDEKVEPATVTPPPEPVGDLITREVGPEDVPEPAPEPKNDTTEPEPEPTASLALGSSEEVSPPLTPNSEGSEESDRQDATSSGSGSGAEGDKKGSVSKKTKKKAAQKARQKKRAAEAAAGGAVSTE
ncbi:hypothetical protein L202_02477 [Cryptococcus amylolentus CBS 6039]|uniref:Mob1/phocein n=2 Tax=Cryptococcus amylolentus TaxID=104669 RepID=A0A1E3I0U7_9TREE|nr:hypothetical protein L202_02477 [Cryptococcus amylolentus CBS 6039]ODN82187.1 hypothetical protein L202_02477 [Cryptococcus amylolentus CBS 6039]ODO09724.1 hypothetical protein I350_01940 [Cryptococcus amylolentus CBS 6273]